MEIRWDDLRIFLSVARSGGLTGAAGALKIDPATVGRRIAALEASLDRALFAKSPQGYALTEAGTRLLPRAEAIEAELRAGTEDLTGQGDGLTGAVRISAPDGCANFLLPKVCVEMSAENPGLDIQILASPRVANLSRREADMAITVSPPKSGRLLVQKIADYGLHLAGSATYLETAAPITSKADLKAHPIVGYVPDMIFDDELDYLGALGLSRVSLASTSVAVQVALLRQGTGIGIVHDFALPAAPELTRLLTEEVSLTRTFYLVRHADDRRSQRMQRFAGRLIQGMRAALSDAATQGPNAA